jgi:anaerobic magnesium-protoporphyrin IX monomethyl ester cyclase
LKTKILLVAVGRTTFKGALWGAYDVDFPLNVAYVAAFLESNGIAVDVIDFQASDNPLARLTSSELQNYALIGMSANLGNAYVLYDMASRLKKNSRDAIIACFGMVTLLKEIILLECQDIDYVVYGEEEHTMLELSRGALNGGLPGPLTGACFRSEGEMVVSPPRAFEQELDRFPFPARHMFDMSKYYPSPGKYKLLPQFTMLSNRGCNGNCRFCERLGGKGVRHRSVESVVAEIEHLQRKYGAREIYFLDETFTADRDRAMFLADVLKRRKNKPYLRISARVDTVDYGLLKSLKQAGVYSVGYGIESGDDDILAFNSKGITCDQSRKAVNIAKELGLEVRGFFMLNLPGENRETTERTIRFIEELPLDLMNIQITYPFPGTPIRQYVRREYSIDETRWNDWTCCEGNEVVFIQADLTREYLLKTYQSAIRKFYLNPGFVFYGLKRLRTLHDFKYSLLQFLTLFRRQPTERSCNRDQL